MFNGIIFNLGEIISIKKYSKSILICVKTNLNLKKSELGSSISCNGVCLTISKISQRNLFFYVSNETIRRSNFKNLKVGDKVNLEKSLVYGQKISGNFHVDTTAIIRKITFIDKSWSLKLKLRDKKMKKFLVEKASISINGVSLTIAKVSSIYFYLNIIPHTLKLTNLKDLKKNDLVNVELDIFGKYIYKYSI